VASGTTGCAPRPSRSASISARASAGRPSAKATGLKPAWTSEGAFGRTRLIAEVRHPVHRVDFPLFDQHLAVRLPYSTATPDGLPGEEALAGLVAVQDLITSRLGRDAVLVAVQTAGGERLLHLYADAQASPLATLQGLLASYPGGTATVQAQLDPGWDAVDHQRVASAPG